MGFKKISRWGFSLYRWAVRRKLVASRVTPTPVLILFSLVENTSFDFFFRVHSNFVIYYVQKSTNLRILHSCKYVLFHSMK